MQHRMTNSGIADRMSPSQGALGVPGFGDYGQYQGSEQPFNCKLFPTLQQVVTVMPDEEEWSEDANGLGGFVGQEGAKNQLFGN